MNRHRDELEPLTEADWRPSAFRQEHDDLIFVFLHHDEMYYSFDTVGDDINAFFSTGRFTKAAQRSPCTQDPFQ